jgi:hypothetical protein
VSLESRAIPSSSVSVVGAIARKDSASLNIFCGRYERGLRFLIRRYRLRNADEFFNAVVKATMDGVLRGEISHDNDLAQLIRTNFHRVLLNLAEVPPAQNTQTSEGTSPDAARIASGIRLRLNLFTPLQREALFRFYAREERAFSVCQDLGLTPEHFRFTCKAARQAARLAIEETREKRARAI